MSIQDRANEWYANNVSPQSEYPDGALWTWSEVATFTALEREAAQKQIADELVKILDDDISLAHGSLCELIEKLRGKELDG